MSFGTETRLLAAVAIVVAVATQASSTVASEANSNIYSAAKEELVFSTNDSLCKPLAKLYNELRETHVYADLDTGRTDLAWNWEDRYPKKFAAIGLNTAVPLSDAIHVYNPPLSVHEVRAENGGLVPTNQQMYAFYRVDLIGDGISRIVHIEDLPLGGTALFATNVWILRPGIDIDPSESHNQYSVGPKDQLSPTKVDLAIFFAVVPDGAKQYNYIKSPYFFERILDDQQRKLPIAERLLRQPYVGENSTIQRLFEFQGRFYFVARLGFTALVYVFTKGHALGCRLIRPEP